MNSKLTTIIIDDEQDSRDGMEFLINKELPEIEILAKSHNAQNALEFIMDLNPDLIFLDIQMPEKNGFWLAEKLKKLHRVPSVIFITAFDEFAIEAIKHAAFDFLTKPIDPLLLKESINRFRNNGNQNVIVEKLNSLESFLDKRKLKFNTVNGFIIIDQEDIIFCEADGNYSYIHLINGNKELVCYQIGKLEQKLPASGFIRISRSNIININYLQKFNRKSKSVTLSGIIQRFELSVSSKGIKNLNGI